MNLIETFEDVYKKAFSARIPKYLYHKGNPSFRENILKNGLVPHIGESYELFITDPARGNKHLEKEELQPMVFLYDIETYGDYDSTWDDDKYRIDTSMLNKDLFRLDVLDNCYTYSDVIPPDAIELVYEGTGESLI